MTDARFPERYLSDRRVLKLKPDVFRGWVLTTAWSVSNRTDGYVAQDDLPLLPFMPQNGPATLVSLDLWAAVEGGWLISDFEQTQTSKHDLEVLDNMRRAQRQKKARQRAAKGSTPSFSDVPGDSTGDVYPGTSRGRVPEDKTGEERPGRDQEKWFVENETGEITDPAPSVPAGSSVTTWAVAPIGRMACKVPGCSTDVSEISADVCWSQDDAHNAYRDQHGWGSAA
ncbi:hypothetical protein DEJ33_15735 [Curtobacterium sp. MCPF17_047]|uniref:hypothetical protein n=1 Tax=Curtobacterium sp. MCPF17_047 TaxID=2175654 RepID=UPI000DA990E5|nr:hypothetical protein [Curtobacterium sp. MCPF17_047]PZF61883.1 hypothetical protein DEJ33_15735 [Curtobacterium sp. MCPF17_047]